MTLDVLQPLRRATEGLTYPSESDEPFEVFEWGPAAVSPARDAVAEKGGKSRALQEVSIDQFFSQLDDSDDAERFRALRKTLQSVLSALSVFRVGEGETEVDVYLIGKSHSGRWAGLHTVSVET